MSILVALLALSFLIFVHELGHFLVAKAVGVKVLEFSMFMGPKLLSFTKGETAYSLRLIPMGGFVKMEGEDENSEDPRAFNRQPVFKRALIILAGPVMNFITAFLLAGIVLSSVGFYTNRVTEFAQNSALQAAGMEVGDKFLSYGGKRLFDPASDLNILLYGEDGEPKEIRYYDESEKKTVEKVITPGRTETRFRLGFTARVVNGEATNIVDAIETDSPIMKAGIKIGDRIVAIDGTPLNTTQDIINYLNVTRTDKTAPLTLTVDRGGKTLTFDQIVPFSDFQYTLGVGLEHKIGNFGEILNATGNYSVSTIRNVVMTLGWLFEGKLSFKELSGPVGIINTVGSVVETEQPLSETVIKLLYLCSFISINLGVMNLIPFPALDGSILLLLLIEKIRGKPLPQEKMGLISMIGFVLLVCVLIATLFNDIPRLSLR